MRSKIRLTKHQWGVVLVVVFSLVTRLWHLGQPPGYYFDEVYHVSAVKLVANLDWRAFEWWHPPFEGIDNHDWLHPPLAKYFQAASINLFGVRAWAWRLPSALFGTLGIALTYLLAKELFGNKRLSLLAAALLSLDGLHLVQSRIGMNDIIVSFFISLSWLLFVLLAKRQQLLNRRGRLILFALGVCLGLGISTKWSAVFSWMGINFLSWGLILYRLRRSKLKLAVVLKGLSWPIFCLLLLPVMIYLLSYAPVIIALGFGHLVGLHKQIVWYQFHRDGIHAYASRPWQWVLNLKPVWYWVSQRSMGNKAANIYAQGNSSLYLIGLLGAITAVVSWLKKTLGKLELGQLFSPLSLLLSAYFINFIPWIFSPRIVFFYHYLPAVPFLVILAAWVLEERVRLKSTKLYWAILILIGLNFVLFYPNWTGIAVSQTIVDRIY